MSVVDFGDHGGLPHHIKYRTFTTGSQLGTGSDSLTFVCTKTWHFVPLLLPM